MTRPVWPREHLGDRRGAGRTSRTVTSNAVPSSASRERLLVERVGVEVLDRGRRLGALVRAAVQDRDVVAAVDEPPDERDPRRPRPPDHQHVHGAGGYRA